MKRVIVVSALLILCGLAASASGQEQPQRINREFRAAMGQKLEFDLDTGGGIHVIGWDSPLISVEAYKGGRDGADCRIDFQETATGLRITSEYQGRERSFSTNISFVVRVPKRFDLDFDSMGGGINICGVEGRITGKTMGGGLTLNNLAGELNLVTMGGGIRLTNSEVNGKVETMGGGVLIENVTGDVRGSTMGGRVVRRNTGDRAGRTPGAECAAPRARDL
ncbi:MAG TPA: hypothetical protein VF544_03995 [Pyrinomonadaceae bacterium]